MAEKREDRLMDIEIGRLKPHPNNPRKGDVNAIMQSLERFGQVKPLIVQRSTGYVVAGNHTLRAAERLKWPTVSILIKDLTDEEAQAYLLADNRTSDKGTYDTGALTDLLLQVADLEGTGYDIDDLETLQDELGGNVAGDTSSDPVKIVTPIPNSNIVEGQPREANRDIVLLMPQSAAQEFGRHVAQLQKVYGTRTVVETVRRAVAEAVDVL